MIDNEKSLVLRISEKIFDRFTTLSVKTKSCISLAIFVVAFILGILAHKSVSIKQSDIDDLNSDKEKISVELKRKEDELTKKTEEFNLYKEKMKPYEETQKADEQARIEAEQLAKKQAEEKAAEEQRKKDEALKAQSFDISVSDFITSFNDKMEILGSSVFAFSNYDTSKDFITIKTSSESVFFNINLQQGRITDIFLNGKGTGTAQSGIDQIYSMVATAQTVDSSLGTSEISNFLVDMIKKSQQNLNSDYSKKKNGITYIVNSSTGATLFTLRKR